MLSGDDWRWWLYPAGQSIAGLCLVHLLHCKKACLTAPPTTQPSWIGTKVSGIGGGVVPSNHGTVNVNLSSAYRGGRSLPMETIVLPKISSDMPSCFVPFDKKWKHLVGLPFYDSDFRVPRSIDILLGADIFNRVVIQCPVLGLPGTPSKKHTCFGWTLTGTIRKVCAPRTK